MGAGPRRSADEPGTGRRDNAHGSQLRDSERGARLRQGLRETRVPTHPEREADGRPPPQNPSTPAERGFPCSTFSPSIHAVLWPTCPGLRTRGLPRSRIELKPHHPGTPEVRLEGRSLPLNQEGTGGGTFASAGFHACLAPALPAARPPSEPRGDSPAGALGSASHAYRSLCSSFRLSSRSRQTTSQTCWASSSVSLERSSFLPISAPPQSHTWRGTDGSGQLTHGARANSEATDVPGSSSRPD